jgi:hypothetical protein
MRALVAVVQVPHVVAGKEQNARQCEPRLEVAAFVLRDTEANRERVAGLISKFRYAKRAGIGTALEVLSETGHACIRGLPAVHVFGALKVLEEQAKRARRIDSATRLEELYCTHTSEPMARYIMLRAAVAYEVEDVRDLLGAGWSDYVTIFFTLRGPTYALRGKVHWTVLLELQRDWMCARCLELLADAAIGAGGLSHTLQEVLIEEGVVREVVSMTYAGYMSRSAWQRVYARAVESGLKENIRLAVREALAAR